MNRTGHTGLKRVFNLVEVVAGVVVLVTLVISLSKLFSSLIPPPPSQTQKITPPSPQTDWQTYTDGQLEFSITFPASWYYELNPDFQKPRVVPDALEVRVMFASSPPPFLGPATEIQSACRLDVLAAITSQSANQILSAERYKQIGSPSGPIHEESIVVGGIKGIKRFYLSEDGQVESEKHTAVLIPDTGKIFALYFWSPPQTTTCDGFFDTMVSSFHIGQ